MYFNAQSVIASIASGLTEMRICSLLRAS